MAARYGRPTGWAEEGKRSTFPTPSKGSLLRPRPSSSAPPFLGQGSFYPSSSEDERAITLRIHSQAEKRRRERINSHLSTLRRMIPNSNKMDKASLLGRVIEHVKDLKRKAVDASTISMIPTEANVVTVESDAGYQNTFSLNDDNLYIKASLCCDDRPDLFAELIEAFRRLRLRTIRVDSSSLGGRIRNVFLLCRKDSTGSVCLNSLKESIKEALDRVASVDMVPSNAFISKRQRLLQPRFPSSNISL
ncbi:transcription factor bHLH51-like [Phoenix dactylifera]|uniref:Transcription factor bHLH51-like n=1 Tax=Phoenix dactylifera TaxID=42345 RepID=A0A8B9ANL7_PHODC|nr:transcription factor bHLH51-like [Phoenix dactylifera]